MLAVFVQITARLRAHSCWARGFLWSLYRRNCSRGSSNEEIMDKCCHLTQHLSGRIWSRAKKDPVEWNWHVGLRCAFPAHDTCGMVLHFLKTQERRTTDGRCTQSKQPEKQRCKCKKRVSKSASQHSASRAKVLHVGGEFQWYVMGTPPLGYRPGQLKCNPGGGVPITNLSWTLIDLAEPSPVRWGVYKLALDSSWVQTWPSSTQGGGGRS